MMNKSAQKCTERNAPMCYDTGKASFAFLLSLKNYRHEEMRGRATEIVDPNNPARSVKEGYCHALAELLCFYKYGYVRSMMELFFPCSESGTVDLGKCC